MAGHGQGYYEALKVRKLFEKDLGRVLENVKLWEERRRLAEAALAEKAGPDLTPADKADLLKQQIDGMVGEESKAGQEADKVSREQKSAEDLERLKKGDSDADLADL